MSGIEPAGTPSTASTLQRHSPFETQTTVSGPNDRGGYTAVTTLTINDETGAERKFKLTRTGISAEGRSGPEAAEFVKQRAEVLIKSDQPTQRVITVGLARIGAGGRTERVSYNYSEGGAMLLHKRDGTKKVLVDDKFNATPSKTRFYETLKALQDEPNPDNLPPTLAASSSSGKSDYQKIHNRETLSYRDLMAIARAFPSPDDENRLFPFKEGDRIDLREINIDAKLEKWKSKEKAFSTAAAIFNHLKRDISEKVPEQRKEQTQRSDETLEISPEPLEEEEEALRQVDSMPKNSYDELNKIVTYLFTLEPSKQRNKLKRDKLIGHFCNRMGVESDDPETKKVCFFVALDHHNNYAGRNLSDMYEHGKGVPQNLWLALGFFRIAVHNDKTYPQEKPFDESNLEHLGTLEAKVASQEGIVLPADDDDVKNMIEFYHKRNSDELKEWADKGDPLARYALETLE